MSSRLIPRRSAPALSPAWAKSRVFWNISRPVTTVFSTFSWIPTISTSLPDSILPCSMRPVTTVPRPVIVNTSSIGIRNGLFTSRPAARVYESPAPTPPRSFGPHRLGGLRHPLAVALERLERRDLDDRDVVAGELVLREQLTNLELDELEQLRVVDHVVLVQRDDDRRHLDLARKQDVLARLRHRPVGRGDDEDRAVHLSGARDHVLDVVGVPRAVDVRVVALLRLVLDVRRVDRDAAGLLLGSVVDLLEALDGRGAADALREHLRDRSRQRRLAMVDVTDRPDVEVRLRALELLLCHASPSVLTTRSRPARRQSIAELLRNGRTAS